jgi:hypothetical protein
MNPHERIDDYLDGELDPTERAAFEAALRADPSLRDAVDRARALSDALGALPKAIEPERDLWPAIDAATRPRRVWPWLAAGAGALLAATCAGVLGVLWLVPGADPSPALAAAESGDLVRAERLFADLAGRGASDPDVATGVAWSRLLVGDYAGADAALAAATPSTDQALADLLLRRALVAQRAGDLDAVKAHGRASGTGAGLVLAAEVHLADLETTDAIELLSRAASSPGVVGDTASGYLDLLHGSTAEQGLAEATALWSLGRRDEGCRAAADVVPDLPEGADPATAALVWAGRCAGARQPDAAERLLDTLVFAPPGQQWRVGAVRAQIATLRGDVDAATGLLDALRLGGAPEDGLDDARATAAVLAPDAESARRLVADATGAAAARALAAHGVGADAARRAPPGSPLARWLEGR